MGLKATAWLVAANHIIAYMIIIVNTLLQKYLLPPGRQIYRSLLQPQAKKL